MSMRNVLAGDYEILGDDDRFIAGADDDLMSILAGADTDAAKTAIMARNGLVLRRQMPNRSRRFPLGFASDGTVAAGASVVIVSRPQVLFRGERLVIPSDIAGDFVIDDVKIGKNSQLVAEGPIPARALQEDAIDVWFQLDTAQISQDISLSVTNIAGAARQFRAALVGRAAEL